MAVCGRIARAPSFRNSLSKSVKQSRCYEAGASVIHFHARDADGRNNGAREIYAEVIRRKLRINRSIPRLSAIVCRMSVARQMNALLSGNGILAGECERRTVPLREDAT
jgi:beta-keto acid cleavage enzyme